jgi:dipeptidyl aminopeptidase/acylaminoacyl peptidase
LSRFTNWRSLLTLNQEPSGLIFVDEAQPDGRRGILEIDESGHDVRNILPPPYNVGSAVYEYGGGAWTVNKAGNIIFSDTSGNAVCLLDRRLSTVTRVLEDPNLRFADFDPHPVDSRWVAAIQEDHKEPGSSKVRHRLVLIDMEEGEYQILHEQHDFYSHVRFAPDGKQICWLSWEHPHMPFTGAVLRVASFDLHSRRITGEKLVGSKPAESSIGQPRWHDDGTLYFLDTSSGYWQLYSYRTGQEHPDHVRIEGMDDCDLGNAEFGLGR